MHRVANLPFVHFKTPLADFNECKNGHHVQWLYYKKHACLQQGLLAQEVLSLTSAIEAKKLTLCVLWGKGTGVLCSGRSKHISCACTGAKALILCVSRSNGTHIVCAHNQWHV